jgi:hypothetical protein
VTHSNPLLQKYEELYGKKEPPKMPRIEDYEGEETIAEELKELRDTSTVPANTPNIITKENHIPSLKTYDVDSGKDSFLQIAEKIKNGKAQVVSMSMERDIMSGTKITFDVYVND